jgi:hypothetical protein
MNTLRPPFRHHQFAINDLPSTICDHLACRLSLAAQALPLKPCHSTGTSPDPVSA